MNEEINLFIAETTKVKNSLYELEFSPSPNDCEPNAIFANKYKIRGVLIDTIEKAKPFLPSNDFISILIWGFFTTKLANNFIECEEPRLEARSRLLEVLNFIESLTDICEDDRLKHFSGLLQYVYNSLAVATDANAEDEAQSSLRWLLKAQTVYKHYKTLIDPASGPECWETLCSSYSPNQKAHIQSIMFECNYTTTLFMLAQVYGNREEKHKSAEYCQETLLRQLTLAPDIDNLLSEYGVVNQKTTRLDEGDSVSVPSADWLVRSLQLFDPRDWSTNAATLGEYYHESNRSEYALECLMTAKIIAWKYCGGSQTNDLGEGLRGTKIWADVARLTVAFSFGLLESGAKTLLASKFTCDPAEPTTPSTYGDLFHQDTRAALEEAFGDSIDNLSVSDVVGALSRPPKVYAEALRIFRWTCRSLGDALLYYRLDDHCSVAIELLRMQANAYDFLSVFEADLARKCCMQKRRADILEDLLHKLNPQYYMVSCRILMTECAQALTALRDLNEEKMKTLFSKASSGSQEATAELSKQIKKVSSLGTRALQMHERFLSSFRIPSTGEEPEFYEERWLRTVLMAHFYSARLHSKSRSLKSSTRDRVECMGRSLAAYETMVAVAERHAREGYEFDVPEVEIAREMVHLLPGQIAALLKDS